MTTPNYGQLFIDGTNGVYFFIGEEESVYPSGAVEPMVTLELAAAPDTEVPAIGKRLRIHKEQFERNYHPL